MYDTSGEALAKYGHLIPPNFNYFATKRWALTARELLTWFWDSHEILREEDLWSAHSLHMDSVHHHLRRLFFEGHEMLARDTHKMKKYAWLPEELEEAISPSPSTSEDEDSDKINDDAGSASQSGAHKPTHSHLYERGQHPSLHQFNAKNETNQAAPTHLAPNSEQAESINAWLASCDATSPKQQARVKEETIAASPATPHS